MNRGTLIYNEEFVWLHVPKCGGSKLERVFEEYFSDVPGLHQDPFSVQTDPDVRWHDSIQKRRLQNPDFLRGEEAVVVSFRQLPSWLESRYNYEVQRNPHLPHDPERLLEGRFLEGTGVENQADTVAKAFVPLILRPSPRLRFIRMEMIGEDFRRVFGEFLDVGRVPQRTFRRRVNATPTNHVPAEISTALRSQDRTVYEHCPYWALLEEMAYGSARPADGPPR